MNPREARTPQLETGELTLRALRVQDAAAAFTGWTSDTEVARFMPWNLHASVKDTEDWLKLEEKKTGSPETYNWGIVEKRSGELIGTIGINLEDGAGELGYCISRKHWSQGYMTQAVQAVLRYAQMELGLAAAYGRVAVENPASARVLQKLGFRDAGGCTYSSYDEKRVFPSREYRMELGGA